MSRIPVSVYIVCKNEIAFLGDCIDSVADFQEIVIVDSGSTDGTLELIEDYRTRGFPIRLFEREWPGFARQKQFALDQCTGPWCLNLDADERVEPELARSIATAVRDDRGAAGFVMKMAQYLPGYGYAPASVHVKPQIRLFHKARAKYQLDQLLHEGLQYDGPVLPIAEGRILHFRNLSLTQDLARANGYATLKARQYHAKGRKPGILLMIFHPLGRFLSSYVMQRYFLCGTAGFIHAATLGVYVFLAEAKLWRMTRRPETPEE